jgi:hypothetical protein
MTYEEKIAALESLLDAVNKRITQHYANASRGRSWNSTRASDNRWLHQQLEQRARLKQKLAAALAAHGEAMTDHPNTNTNTNTR